MYNLKYSRFAEGLVIRANNQGSSRLPGRDSTIHERLLLWIGLLGGFDNQGPIRDEKAYSNGVKQLILSGDIAYHR